MNEINLQTFSEIYCLLNFFPKQYIEKLPKKLLHMIKQNIDSKYFIDVDITKPLEEQNISEDTKNLLVVFKYNYWSDEIEKKNIIEQLNKNENKYQEELLEKYNPDNLFKNQEIDKNVITPQIETPVNMVDYKESFFIKIKNWFKRSI